MGKQIQKQRWGTGHGYREMCSLLPFPSTALNGEPLRWLYPHDCYFNGIICRQPPSRILNIVKGDYQMVLHTSLCPNAWFTTGQWGKTNAALQSQGLLGSEIHKG